MIAVIAEHKLTNEVKLTEAKVLINYLFPNYLEATEELSRRALKLYVVVSKYYSSTLKAIEKYLYLCEDHTVIDFNTKQKKVYKSNKQPLTITIENETMTFKSLKDWNNSKFHIIFKEQIKLNQQAKEITREKQKAIALRQTLSIPDISGEEILRFVRTFAPLYKVEVNYQDDLDVLVVYNQLNWYIENNIPYGLDYSDIYKGAIDPEETPFWNMQFKPVPDWDKLELEYFGDETLLEDTVSKCLR